MERGWIKLWRKMLDNPVLKRPSYRVVWIDILLNANHGAGIKVLFGGKVIELAPGQFTAGAYQISKRTRVPRGTVERILKLFKNEEMIEERTDYQCSLITVKNWERYQKNEEVNEERPRNDRGTGEERVRTKQECKNERMEELKNTPLPPKGNEITFGVFWDNYPRKIAKANALKAWTKLNPNGELCAEIFSALERHRKCEQWSKEGGRFIPHAATWINQERWKDELEEKQRNLVDKFNVLKTTQI